MVSNINQLSEDFSHLSNNEDKVRQIFKFLSSESTAAKDAMLLEVEETIETLKQLFEEVNNSTIELKQLVNS